MWRSTRIAMQCGLGIACVWALCTCVAADPSHAASDRTTFLFRVEGVGAKALSIQGELTVDGKRVVIDNKTTPYEFRCEAANSLVGSFQPIDRDRRIRVKLFWPTYSTKKPVEKAKGSRIAFQWDGNSSHTSLRLGAEQPK